MDLSSALLRFRGAATVSIADVDTRLDEETITAKLIVASGTLTAPRSVFANVPEGADYTLENATTGGQAVTFKGPSGTGITLAPGERRTVIVRNGAIVDALSGLTTTLTNYATKASLVAAPFASGAAAVLGGFGAIGDRGGGLFAFSAGDVTADNGGTVLAVSGGRLKRTDAWVFNVRHFGATGDGITDDTANVQACITAAIDASATSSGRVSVYFPGGKYRVVRLASTTAGLLAASPNALTIYGDGDASELFLDAHPTSGQTLDVGLSLSGAAGYVEIRKLKFSGSCACPLLLGVASAGAEVVDCDFSGFAAHNPSSGYPSAIVGYGNDVVIDGCWFHDAGPSGIKTYRAYTIVSGPAVQAYRWTVRNCTISPCNTTVGIALFDTSDSDISGNSIDLSGARNICDPIGGDGYGIVLYSHGFGGTPKRVTITSNRIANTAGSGIYIASLSEVLVSGNTMINCCIVQKHTGSLIAGAVAVASPTGSRVTVSGNVFVNGYRFGVVFQGNSVTVSGNKHTGGGDVGIYCAGVADGAVIIGNDLREPAGRAAFVSSSSAPVSWSSLAAGQILAVKIDGGPQRSISFTSGDIAAGGFGIAAKIAGSLLSSATMSTPASTGTAPPVMTLSGAPARPDIDLRVEVVGPGAIGWAGRYSPDAGATWRSFTSAATGSGSTLVLDNRGVSTGISMSFAAGTSNANNVWTARVTGGATANATVDLSLPGAVDNGVPNSIFLQSLQRGAGSSVEIVDSTARATLRLDIGVTTGAFSHLIASSPNAMTKCQVNGNRCVGTGDPDNNPNGIYLQLFSEGDLSGNSVTGCMNGISITATSPCVDNTISSNKAMANRVNGLSLACYSSLIRGNISRGNVGFGCLDSGISNRHVDNDYSNNYSGPFTGAPTNQTAVGTVRGSQSAARFGTATLTAGSSGGIGNSEVVSATRLRLTRKTQGAAPGYLSYAIVPTVYDGTGAVTTPGSITITSSAGGDTGQVDWEIVH